MRSFEKGSLAFVIRIWKEPSDLADESLEWRGMIQHVESGERRYFRSTNEMMDFMLPYLKETGIQIVFKQGGKHGRDIKLWLKRRIEKVLDRRGAT